MDNTTASLIYAYAKPNGYCKFNNCSLIIPSNIFIFDGYKNNIVDYSVVFNNSHLPADIKLISDYFKRNLNIKIIFYNFKIYNAIKVLFKF